MLPTRQAEPELVVENKRAGDSRPQNQSSNQRGNRPYELLVSKLVDSLETPSLMILFMLFPDANVDLRGKSSKETE